MASELKIYACTGVGAKRCGTAKRCGSTTGYDMEGTSTVQNTQAMNNLLALMNVTKAEISIADGSAKRMLLEQLDLYSVCFHYAKLYRNDSATLREVGNILSNEIEAGAFTMDSDSLEAHAGHVDTVIEDTDEKLRNSNGVTTGNKEFIAWFKHNVLELNKQGLTEEQVSGIGGAQYGEITEYLEKAGTYFLYLYLTDEQVAAMPEKLRTIVTKRRNKQAELYNYVRKCFTGLFGTEQVLQNITRTSIINEYGMEPAKVVASLYKMTQEDVEKGVRENKQVGDPITLTATMVAWIIVAAIAAAAVIILGIVNACATVSAAKYSAPADVDSAVIDESDLSEWASVYRSTGASSLLLYGGLAAAAYWFFTKKKKKQPKKNKE